MPRVSFPVGWSSLRTTETSAPRSTSLRFRPSIRLAPSQHRQKLRFWLPDHNNYGSQVGPEQRLCDSPVDQIRVLMQPPGCTCASRPRQGRGADPKNGSPRLLVYNSCRLAVRSHEKSDVKSAPTPAPTGIMPTVFRERGFRFFFYSNERFSARAGTYPRLRRTVWKQSFG